MTRIHSLIPDGPAPVPGPSNADIADALDRAAAMLAEREANEHRVAAYARAAETVRTSDANISEMVHAGGPDALEALPGVGERLSQRIAAFVHTGELSLLRELHEAVPPVRLFARLTGIGRETAKKIHTALGVETLEQLEVAAYDGRLGALEGFGDRKVRAIKAQLDAILARQTRRDVRQARPLRPARHSDEPSAADLLSVDDEYRHNARHGLLPTIAPRRFNPTGEAWLPVLETRRGPWRFTALYSNTPRAHELGRQTDWVVLYYTTREGRERQCTVVTETRGDLRGRRVVRGREAECRAFYDTTPERLAA
jgi:DNA polymerase (family X)